MAFYIGDEYLGEDPENGRAGEERGHKTVAFCSRSNQSAVFLTASRAVMRRSWVSFLHLGGDTHL